MNEAQEEHLLPLRVSRLASPCGGRQRLRRMARVKLQPLSLESQPRPGIGVREIWTQLNTNPGYGVQSGLPSVVARLNYF